VKENKIYRHVGARLAKERSWGCAQEVLKSWAREKEKGGSKHRLMGGDTIARAADTGAKKAWWGGT